jgi:hypothetical protein
MPMNIRFNATHLEATIHNTAERAARGASEELRKTAIRIRDLAREYAPRDTGTLEKAIDYMTIKDPATRRNVFVVYIDEDMINPGSTIFKKDGSTSGRREAHAVGSYAWIMEEQLHPHGRQTGAKRYSLGKFTSAVKAAGGKKVGGRFLSRAIKKGTERMVSDATGAVRRVLGGTRRINIDYERQIGGDEE